MNIWNDLKNTTENNWLESELYDGVSGYQIQPGTKWNIGLSNIEIKELEEKFGFQFPIDYKAMLTVINGFDRPCVEVYEDEEYFEKTCYSYPEDFESLAEVFKDLKQYRQRVELALDNAGFNIDDIVGFVPLYSHRVLVVFHDKSLTPIVSILGDDVIVYDKSLLKYWQKEFEAVN